MDISSLIKNRLRQGQFELVDPNEVSITDHVFLEEFDKLKNWLMRNSPSTGVGIKLPKDHRYLMTILACMETGIYYVPMKDNYPDSRVEQIQEESGYQTLMDEKLFQEIIKAPVLPTLPPKVSTPDDILYIICTSGSTGRPKAVVVQRKALGHYWKWVGEKFSNVTPTDRALQVTDFTFDISLIDVALFLTRGCSLYFSSFKGNIFQLAYEIENYKISVLNTVVNNVNMLLDDQVVSRANYQSLHTVMMGGARFSYGLYKKCLQHLSHIGVHNLYGVTEVPIYSHCKTMNFDQTDLHEFTVSVGIPSGACSCIIVKEGRLMPKGEKGEVLLGGGSLMKEYAGQPEKTAEVFIMINDEKYYRTGDIGFQAANGDFFVTGRMDDTIKYRGYRINLLDVDSYILSRPYVQDSVTIAIENEETQNTTICFIILKEDKTEKEIRKDLSAILLDYQIPEKIHFVKAYPTNNNGKVCKKTLKLDYIEGKRFYQ